MTTTTGIQREYNSDERKMIKMLFCNERAKLTKELFTLVVIFFCLICCHDKGNNNNNNDEHNNNGNINNGDINIDAIITNKRKQSNNRVHNSLNKDTRETRKYPKYKESNNFKINGSNNNSYKHGISNRNVISEISPIPTNSAFGYFYADKFNFYYDDNNSKKHNEKNIKNKSNSRKQNQISNQNEASYKVYNIKDRNNDYKFHNNDRSEKFPTFSHNSRDPPTARYVVQEEFTPMGAEIGKLSDLRIKTVDNNIHTNDNYIASRSKSGVYNGNSWTYKLLVEDPLNIFQVHSNSGVISTKDNLDREGIAGCQSKHLCEVSFHVGMYGSNFQMIKVTVEVLDINDNRPFFKKKKVKLDINEASAFNSSYLLPSAIDLDSPANGITNYSLLDPSNTFEIEQIKTTPLLPNNYQVKLILKKKLDRESVPNYFITLTANDPPAVIAPTLTYFSEPQTQGNNQHQLQPPTNTLNIEISVLDSNDNKPKFFNEPYEESVKEGVKINTFIMKIEAADADQGDNGVVSFTFSRQTLSLHGNLFEIDEKTGIIVVRSALDFEKATQHQLVVVAKDHGKNVLTSETVVMVKVEDENDNVPSIKIHTANGDKEEDAIYAVLHNTAAELLWTKKKDKTSLLNGNSNKKKINYSKNQIENYRDSNRFVNQTDRPIKFGGLITERTEVFEDAVIFTFVAHVRVNDEDSNQNGKTNCSMFQLTEPQDRTSTNDPLPPHSSNQHRFLSSQHFTHQTLPTHFRIVKQDDHEYHIETSALLDREDTDKYTTLITCHDHGTPSRSSEQVLIVNIIDINDCRPTFKKSHYNATILENNAVNAPVVQLEATDSDADINALFTYSFQGRVDNFAVNSHTGLITAIYSIDWEVFKGVRFTVVAVDQGEPALTGSCSVEIHVQDVNDQTPTFTQREYRFNVSENNLEGVAIGYVVAHDNDSDAYNSFAFSFLVPPSLNTRYASKLHSSGYFSHFFNNYRSKSDYNKGIQKAKSGRYNRAIMWTHNYRRFMKKSLFYKKQHILQLQQAHHNTRNQNNSKHQQVKQKNKQQRQNIQFERFQQSYSNSHHVKNNQLKANQFSQRSQFSQQKLRRKTRQQQHQQHKTTTQQQTIKQLNKPQLSQQNQQRLILFQKDRHSHHQHHRNYNTTNTINVNKHNSAKSNHLYLNSNKHKTTNKTKKSHFTFNNYKNPRLQRNARKTHNYTSETTTTAFTTSVSTTTTNDLHNPISLNPYSGFLTLKYRFNVYEFIKSKSFITKKIID